MRSNQPEPKKVYARIGKFRITAPPPGTPNFYISWEEPNPKKPGTDRTIRASTGTSDETEAEAFLAQFAVQNGRPEPEAVDTAQIGPIVQRYFDEHAVNLTSANSARIECARIIECMGARTVRELAGSRLVNEYIKTQRAAGYRDATINRDLMNLRAALNRAHDGDEPILTERPPKVRAIPEDDFAMEPEVKEVFTPTQLRELLQRSRRLEHFFRWCLISAATSCRPDAAFDLAPRQVDLEYNLIDLNPPGRKQTKKRRPVVRLVEAVRPYFVEWMRGADPTTPFVTYNGEAVGSVITAWNAIVKGEMNLTGKYVPYSLRHTISTLLGFSGVDEVKIGKQLGHSRREGSRVTGTYIHKKAIQVSPEYLRETTEGINAILTEALKPVDAGNVVDIKNRNVA